MQDAGVGAVGLGGAGQWVLVLVRRIVQNEDVANSGMVQIDDVDQGRPRTWAVQAKRKKWMGQEKEVAQACQADELVALVKLLPLLVEPDVVVPSEVLPEVPPEVLL